jgi:hypothetical protein
MYFKQFTQNTIENKLLEWSFSDNFLGNKTNFIQALMHIMRTLKVHTNTLWVFRENPCGAYFFNSTQSWAIFEMFFSIFQNIEGATSGFPQNMLVPTIPIYSKNLDLIGQP